MSGIKSSIDPSQFGNRKGHATAYYLIDVLNAVLRDADKPKTISTLLAADFSKAFDRIKHNIVVTKMLEMNAPPAVVAWICSFLPDREQCVKYMSTLSEWKKVTAGAPQGTLLGPVICLCMINDACRDSTHPSWKYVDDISLLECRKVNDPTTIQNSVIPQSHLLYGGRTVAVKLQNRVIPAVAVEILYGESPCFTGRRGGRRIIARSYNFFFISTFAVEI